MRPFYLLDTNIISEVKKPLVNSQLLNRFIKNQKLSAIPVIAWNEALYGVKRMPEGAKRDALEEFLINEIQSDFEIIPFDSNVAWVYTDLKAKLEKAGKTPPEEDLQIAATAIANGMILVTRNTKDFEVIKENSTLCLDNWFEED